MTNTIRLMFRHFRLTRAFYAAKYARDTVVYRANDKPASLRAKWAKRDQARFDMVRLDRELVAIERKLRG